MFKWFRWQAEWFTGTYSERWGRKYRKLEYTLLRAYCGPEQETQLLRFYCKEKALVMSDKKYLELCKECVAVLIVLYKKNGAVSHVRINFYSI